MQCKILIFLSIFCVGCATKIQYVPLKCEVIPPIKPNCADFIESFDCLKAKSKYLNALELTLKKCL